MTPLGVTLDSHLFRARFIRLLAGPHEEGVHMKVDLLRPLSQTTGAVCVLIGLLRRGVALGRDSAAGPLAACACD